MAAGDHYFFLGDRFPSNGSGYFSKANNIPFIPMYKVTL